MANKYQIRLNFIPVKVPRFTVFRRRVTDLSERRTDNNVRRYRLPTGIEEAWADYWISVDAREGWEKYDCSAETNVHLSLWLLHRSLFGALVAVMGEGNVVAWEGIAPELHLQFDSHPEGIELLVIQPYYLSRTHQIGFCANFRFEKKASVPFSRRVQQLSLSLTAQGRRNLDACGDHWQKIEKYLGRVRTVIENFAFLGATDPARTSSQWVSLESITLHPRTFVFSNGKSGVHPFSCIKDFGPYAAPAAPVNLLFMFEENCRAAARDLVAALRGSPALAAPGYPGFEEYFRTKLQIDASPIVLTDWSQSSLRAAVQSAKKRASDTTVVVGVGSNDEEPYLVQKALFTEASIPTQHCTLGVIGNRTTLKWSVANIALQIFSKAGGLPWKMHPGIEPALIIGISQAHHIKVANGRRNVEKYFAFSILTDSTGAFRSIRTLAERHDRTGYLDALSESLTDILSSATAPYKRVAIHATYKMKQAEMTRIKDAVKAASGSRACEFSVLRINPTTHFVGANDAQNSLVPFEATQVSLGARKSLIWFDGIRPQDPTVRRVYAGPALVELMNLQSSDGHSEEDLLQELLDLSGANWRGFNARSAPISTYYCHLVAEIVQKFYARGLPIPTGEIKSPWFI